MKRMICLILIISFTMSCYPTTYEYIKKINNKVSRNVWEVTEKKDLQLLYFKTTNIKETIRSDKKSGTISWLFEDKLKQTFLKAEKYKNYNKNFIKITGILNGNKIEKEYEIEDKLWFQNIMLEAKEYILSDKNELEFYMISKSNGELVSMKLEKKEVQEKTFFNKKIQVIRAEIKENNIFLDLKADYWFRKEDGLCIAYSGYDDNEQKNKVIVKLVKEIK